VNIGIIGGGNIGVAMSRFWIRNGHQVMLSFARDDKKLRATAANLGKAATSGSVQEAVAYGEVLVLAVPWSALHQALNSAGSLTNKVLFTTVNALLPDMSGLAVGTTTSAAEEIARLAPGARVVEALLPFAETLDRGSAEIAGERTTVFYCGDDSKAKQIVAGLVNEIGVMTVDAGPLRSARFIEPAMMLLVQLAYPLGMGAVGLKLLRT
jgi:predicted dinucleotide-binding enzyme